MLVKSNVNPFLFYADILYPLKTPEEQISYKIQYNIKTLNIKPTKIKKMHTSFPF